MRRNDTMAAVLLIFAACSSGPSTADRASAEQAYADAEQALRAGDFDRAIARANDAISGAPDAPKPYLVRAKARAAKGQTSEAEADFGKAIEKSRTESKSIYHFWRGIFHSDGGRHEQALADFTKACELQLKHPVPEYYIECFRERGKAYLALGRAVEAVQDFDFILARNPDEATRREITALRDQALRRK